MNKIYEKSAQLKTIDGLKQILKHPKLYDKQLVDAVTTELERRRSIDLSFEKKSFFARAFRDLIMFVVMAFIISLFFKPQSDQTSNVFIVCYIVFCLLIIIVELIKERYYLLALKADEKTIDIQFLTYENEMHFSSNIKDVEINYKKSFRHRFPILEIKHNGKRVIKLYSNSGNNLGQEQMDLLITDLQEYKNAAAKNNNTRSVAD